MNTILVSIKEVYGMRNVYPVCETAKLFAQIAETKTLTPRTLEHIKTLGYAVQVQPQSL